MLRVPESSKTNLLQDISKKSWRYSWNTLTTRGVNPGGWGSRHPDFGQGVVGRSGSRGGRGRVVKYYYILSCTGSMFESGDVWREIV